MPKYSTTINAQGSDGNVFVVLGTAKKFMHQLGETNQAISDLTNAVFKSVSYDTALKAIEKYFKVER